MSVDISLLYVARCTDNNAKKSILASLKAQSLEDFLDIILLVHISPFFVP